MSVLTNGPEALAAVAALSAPQPRSVRSGRPAAGGRILFAADESSIDALSTLVSTLPHSARGQVFVEVASAEDIVLLEVPELVTVSWLTRESRSGNPGTSRRCAHGQALERAVTAWVSEMVTGDAEHDDGEVTAWVGGSGTRVYELRQALIERLGTGSGADAGSPSASELAR